MTGRHGKSRRCSILRGRPWPCQARSRAARPGALLRACALLCYAMILLWGFVRGQYGECGAGPIPRQEPQLRLTEAALNLPLARMRGRKADARPSHRKSCQRSSQRVYSRQGEEKPPRQVRFRPRRGSSAIAGTSDRARAYSKPLDKLTSCLWLTSEGYISSDPPQVSPLFRPLCNSSSGRALLRLLGSLRARLSPQFFSRFMMGVWQMRSRSRHCVRPKRTCKY